MRTTRRKWHYAGPRMSTTLCGIGLASPKNPWLVPKTEEVTCLLCLITLTEPWHGTTGGYRNHDCRCGPCTQANTEHVAHWRATHKGLEPPYHGEYAYNMFSCRCGVCKEEHRLHSIARRAAR